MVHQPKLYIVLRIAARCIYTSLLCCTGWFMVAGLPLPLLAGNGNDPAGARASGLSNASVTLSDAWSTFYNQAGMAYLKSPAVGFHFEDKFALKELAMQAGTFAMPVKPGAFGISYRFKGYSKFYEAKFGLAYSRKFTESFAAGIQIDYLQTHIAEDYGNVNAVTAELGLLAKPFDNLLVGFHLYNPARVKHSPVMEGYIPTVAKLGIGYQLEGQATLLFETEKDMDQEPVFKGGFEIEAFQRLYLRGGFSSGYEQFAFGIGYKHRKLIMDMAFSRHFYLGFTPHVSVGYEF